MSKTKKPDQSQKFTTVKIPKSIHQELTEAAEREGRLVQAMVERALVAGLKAMSVPGQG